MESELKEFEIFDNNIVGRVVDSITITKNYQINFPSAFYKNHNLYDKSQFYCILISVQK